jgi:5,10-methylenetetrahydrofolate reductase
MIQFENILFLSGDIIKKNKKKISEKKIYFQNLENYLKRDDIFDT